MRILVPLSIVAALLAMGLGGCEPLTEVLPSPAIGDPSTTLTYEEAGDVKYYASDEPLRLATENFNRGSFGLAERYFRDAVEKAPKDVTAWIGLAASYDRLARFDLADRAYANAIRLAGETTQIADPEQSGLLIYAAWGLEAGPSHVHEGLCAGTEKSYDRQQSPAAEFERSVHPARSEPIESTDRLSTAHRSRGANQ
jgi:hypothetical protein